MGSIGKNDGASRQHPPVRLELDPAPWEIKAEKAKEPVGLGTRLLNVITSIRDRITNAMASVRDAIVSLFRGRDPTVDPLINVRSPQKNSTPAPVNPPGQDDRRYKSSTDYFPRKAQTDTQSGSPDTAASDLLAKTSAPPQAREAGKKILSTSNDGVDTYDAQAEELELREKVDALLVLSNEHLKKPQGESEANSKANLEVFLRWSSRGGVNSSRPQQSLLDGESVLTLIDAGEKIRSLLDIFDQEGKTAPKVLNELRGAVSTLRRLLSTQTAQTEIAPEPKPKKSLPTNTVSDRPPLENPSSTAPLRSYIPEPPRPRPDDAAALKKYAQWFFPNHVNEGERMMKCFAEFFEQSLLGKPVTASGFELHELFAVLRALDAKQFDVPQLDSAERYFLSDGRDRLRRFLRNQPERLFSLTDVHELPTGWHWPDETSPVTTLNDDEISQIRVFIKQAGVKEFRSVIRKALGLSEGEGDVILNEVLGYLKSSISKKPFNGNINQVRIFMFRWAVLCQLGKMGPDLLPSRFRDAFLPELVQPAPLPEPSIRLEPESSLHSEIQLAFSSLVPARVGAEKIYQSAREDMLEFLRQDFERLIIDSRLSTDIQEIRWWAASLEFRLASLDLQDADGEKYELNAIAYPSLPEDKDLSYILGKLMVDAISNKSVNENDSKRTQTMAMLMNLLKLHSRSLPSE